MNERITFYYELRHMEPPAAMTPIGISENVDKIVLMTIALGCICENLNYNTWLYMLKMLLPPP